MDFFLIVQFLSYHTIVSKIKCFCVPKQNEVTELKSNQEAILRSLSIISPPAECEQWIIKNKAIVGCSYFFYFAL